MTAPTDPPNVRPGAVSGTAHDPELLDQAQQPREDTGVDDVPESEAPAPEVPEVYEDAQPGADPDGFGGDAPAEAVEPQPTNPDGSPIPTPDGDALDDDGGPDTAPPS